MSSVRQGNFAKYYIILHALLCDAVTQLCYDLHSKACLHMSSMYFVGPRIFMFNKCAEYVYVMEKCYQFCKTFCEECHAKE
jgi:hypothetical protein